MIRYFMLALSLGALGSGTVRAAEPTITGQFSSLDTLGAKALTLGQSYLKAKTLDQARQAVVGSIPATLTELIDRKRDIGFYATLTEDIFNSRVVVLLPLVDEKAFLKAIKSSGLDVKENPKEGVYSIVVPGLPIQAFMKMADGYGYLSLLSAKALDDKERLAPKVVILPDTKAIMELRVAPSAIPAQFKELAEMMLTQYVKDASDKTDDELAKSLLALASKIVTRNFDLLMRQSDQLTFRLDITSNGMLSTEIEITPKTGSHFAKDIASTPATTQQFASLWTPDTVGMAQLKLPLFNEELQQLAIDGLANLQKSVVAEIHSEAERAYARAILQLHEQSVRDKKGDIAALIRGPDVDGHMSALIAIQTSDATSLSEKAKAYIQTWPEDQQKRVEVSKRIIPGCDVFILDFNEMINDKVTEVFTESKIYVAFAKTGVYAAIGPKSRELIAEAIGSKAINAPVIDTHIHWAQVKKVLALYHPDTLAQVEEAIDLKNANQPLLQLNVERGKTLQIRFSFVPLFTAGVASDSIPVPAP